MTTLSDTVGQTFSHCPTFYVNMEGNDQSRDGYATVST